jgi:hypothetical protein
MHTFLWIFLLVLAPALADEIESHPWGDARTPRDAQFKQAVDTCDMHPKDPLFWPEPCTTAERQYVESGAKAKFDEIESNEKHHELDIVRGAISK